MLVVDGDEFRSLERKLVRDEVVTVFCATVVDEDAAAALNKRGPESDISSSTVCPAFVDVSSGVAGDAPDES